MSDSKFTIIIIGLAIIGTGLLVVFRDRLKEPSPQLVGQELADDNTKHLAANDPPYSYLSNPPASGPHDPEPADWGYYDQELPDTKAIHNLEHGGIWVTYQPNVLNDEEKDQLRDLAKRYDQRLIVSPRAQNDSKLAVASWRRLEKRDIFDLGIINQFLTTNVNQSPEKLAQ